MNVTDKYRVYLKEKNISGQSIRNYVSDVGHFVRFLENEKHIDPSKLSTNIEPYLRPEVIEEFNQHLFVSGAS